MIILLTGGWWYLVNFSGWAMVLGRGQKNLMSVAVCLVFVFLITHWNGSSQEFPFLLCAHFILQTWIKYGFFFKIFLQLVDWEGGTKISTSSLLLVLFYYISYYLTCLLLSVWIDCNIIFAVMCWLLILLLLILLFKWIIVVDNNYKKCCEDF